MESFAPQIQIPNPCHERWDAMSQQEKGRFCGVCSKTVVDFGNQSKAEIFAYMRENKDQKVCGRIPASLLENPVQVSYEHKIQLSRFAFALVLTFGSFLFGYGQGNNGKITIGKVLAPPPVQVHNPDTLSLVDSLQGNVPLPVIDTSVTVPFEEPMILGLMVAPVQPPVEIMTKGEVQLIEKPEEE